MKRSASASFDKEIMKLREEEHIKKITKSVQTKKSAAKLHDDIEDYPSPIRVKKDLFEAPQQLEALTVNETPTEKERAAAKAARLRLGYEQADSIPPAAVEERANAMPVICPTGPDPVAVVEVEYTPTEELQLLDNVEGTVKSIVTQLGTKDWQEMCQSLNVVRQLTVHHPEACIPLLSALVPAVLKLFKNPRSSVCKMAVLCLADLLQILRDAMLPHLDVGGHTKPAMSVLSQLFLKSSTDKHFLAEEIQKVLTIMGQNLNAIKFTELLIPYVSEHKNPKVRGKAGRVLAVVTERLTEKEWTDLGMAKILKTAAVLVTDKTPDAREAARIMILKILSVFRHEQPTDDEAVVDGAVTVNVSVLEKAASGSKASADVRCVADASDEEEPSGLDSWKVFCEEHLTMTQAIAVLKIQPANTS